MIGIVKEAIKKPFIKKQNKKYDKQLQDAYLSYNSWVTKLEKKENRAMETLAYERDDDREAEEVSVIAYDQCCNLEKFVADSNDILIFTRESNGLSEVAIGLIISYFEQYSHIKILYGDEDEWNIDATIRLNPWLKPDWSPDTLLSYFYFGNVVALRKELAKEILECKQLETDIDWEVSLYDFILQATGKCKDQEIFHCNRVLYHSHKIEVFGSEKKFDAIKEKATARLLSMNDSSKIAGKSELISIIIPSKDNVETLSTCIASVYQYSSECTFEIIVVDNGSCESNQEQLKELQKEYHFRDHYQSMAFNFSKMCNIGASLSKGDLLLFLNDDVEVREAGWLTLLKEKAVLPYVGAVGVKLLYPHSHTIQHAGITNLKLGPVHKLQFHEDIYEMTNKEQGEIKEKIRIQYKYGGDHIPSNVLAVTGACLMMKREIFQQVEGFSEELQVAFNDVDLCFKLYEKGYHNVVRNDVTLWHHESLSRGNDETREKLERLQREKERLYELHLDLYGKDPYYHPYFSQDILDTNYSFLYQYDGKTVLQKQSAEIYKKEIPTEWENQCLKISLEYAGEYENWSKVEGENGFFFQGYAFVLGSDNSCYERSLLLKNSKDQSMKKVPLNQVYRPDAEVGLGDQVRVNLCGFSVVIPKEQLESGEYQVGILMEHKCCRQKLCNWTNRYIVVK